MSIQLAIFVSGQGSNMEAILRSIHAGEIDGSVEVVVSNDPEARALLVAKEYGVKTVAVSSAGISRAEHEQRVLRALEPFNFDYIVLAGYMRILSPAFLQRFRDPRGFYRIINIHPSLLPAFPGKTGYDDAFAYGVKVSGVTVHLVDEKVDHGPILAQEAFPRLPNDTLETFKARGLAVEHQLYPSVLKQISVQGIRIENPLKESV